MTTPETKELIELAAKALGKQVVFDYDDSIFGPAIIDDEGFPTQWNPATNSADSRSLQVALRIDVVFYHTAKRVDAMVEHIDEFICESAPLGDNPELATCMAVLRCAAEIQRRKEK